MDFRRLEAFTKVYELRSFSRAGEELFLSQPTISAHIASLESTLGVQLFDRLGRMILPTTAGDALYVHARRAFECLDAARAELAQLSENVSGDIHIGSSTIPSHTFLPGVLSWFAETYPEVSFTLAVGDTSAVVKRVASGESTVAVVGASEENPDLVFEPLLHDDLIVVGSPTVVPAKPVTAKDLANLPWVLREEGSGTRKAASIGFSKAGVSLNDLNVRLVVETNHGMLQCAKAGLGVCITSRLAASDAIERGELTEATVQDLSLSREFFCVYHANRNMFPAVRYFIDYLTHQCALLDRSNES